MNANSALRAYRQVNTQGGVADANPHQLVQMLIDGALDKIAAAKGHVSRGEKAEKGVALSKAIAIIGGLRDSLDKEQGGEIAANLDGLYGYMSQRLIEANIHDDLARLNEVSGLMDEVREAWSSIPPELRGAGS